MLYLVMQILLCLILASLVGLIIGWWMRSIGSRNELIASENQWQIKLVQKEEELQQTIDLSSKKRIDAEKQLSKANARAKALQITAQDKENLLVQAQTKITDIQQRLDTLDTSPEDQKQLIENRVRDQLKHEHDQQIKSLQREVNEQQLIIQSLKNKTVSTTTKASASGAGIIAIDDQIIDDLQNGPRIDSQSFEQDDQINDARAYLENADFSPSALTSGILSESTTAFPRNSNDLPESTESTNAEQTPLINPLIQDDANLEEVNIDITSLNDKTSDIQNTVPENPLQATPSEVTVDINETTDTLSPTNSCEVSDTVSQTADTAADVSNASSSVINDSSHANVENTIETASSLSENLSEKPSLAQQMVDNASHTINDTQDTLSQTVDQINPMASNAQDAVDHLSLSQNIPNADKSAVAVSEGIKQTTALATETAADASEIALEKTEDLLTNQVLQAKEDLIEDNDDDADESENSELNTSQPNEAKKTFWKRIFG